VGKKVPSNADLIRRMDCPRCCGSIADIMRCDADAKPPGRVPRYNAPDRGIRQSTALASRICAARLLHCSSPMASRRSSASLPSSSPPRSTYRDHFGRLADDQLRDVTAPCLQRRAFLIGVAVSLINGNDAGATATRMTEHSFSNLKPGAKLLQSSGNRPAEIMRSPIADVRCAIQPILSPSEPGHSGRAGAGEYQLAAMNAVQSPQDLHRWF
jgi:hypothetical protein